MKRQQKKGSGGARPNTGPKPGTKYKLNKTAQERMNKAKEARDLQKRKDNNPFSIKLQNSSQGIF
jgi:hypothetical protein